MGECIRETRSVCPVCLANIPARLMKQGERIDMEKSCPIHGSFSVPVWGGAVDIDSWLLGVEPLRENEGKNCPENCGICSEHRVGTCCTLLEVTKRCNLRCRFCFADGGEDCGDPDREQVKAWIRDISVKCRGTLLQLSGGEPTLREDLPELVGYAKEVGCSYVQVNTNGIRLAEDKDYVDRLAQAGLDIVFLQFDGTCDDIYRTLRGRPLLDTKLAAIRNCAEAKIGVTLVPTVVKGVNTDNLGDLVRLAASLAPGVRGVHFQPVSYFGRYPQMAGGSDRCTLDMLMADISDQANIPIGSFMPSRCDHPLCGFHADFIINRDNTLQPLSSLTRWGRGRSCAKTNRDYIGRRWSRSDSESAPESDFSREMDFDTFLSYMHNRSLSLTAMAFQDAMNLNIERLQSCSLHVYDNGRVLPFCTKYLTKTE